ncbi:MAG: tRNA (adenine(22)-N(1))-methyltransferase [Erysipelotrichaceae bacterium]
MKLSKRLQAIADLIPNGCVVADIGTDHALLPCYLMQEHKARHVYACDVNQGPLDHARETVEKYGYMDGITLRLSNGLAALDCDVEVICIAGMGFETIKMILEADLHRFTKIKALILQSNTDLPELRAWVNARGLTIQKEVMVEDGFTYHVFHLVWGVQTLSPLEVQYGFQLQDDPLWIASLQRRLQHLQSIVAQLPESNSRYQEITAEINVLSSIL